MLSASGRNPADNDSVEEMFRKLISFEEVQNQAIWALKRSVDLDRKSRRIRSVALFVLSTVTIAVLVAVGIVVRGNYQVINSVQESQLCIANYIGHELNHTPILPPCVAQTRATIVKGGHGG